MVDEGRLREQPCVDRIEEQLRPHGHVDDRDLLRRHGLGASEVADQVGPPGPERTPEGGLGIDGPRPC